MYAQANDLKIAECVFNHPCVQICVQVGVFRYVCICACIHNYIQCMHKSVGVCVSLCMCICARICKYMYAACSYVHANTHMYQLKSQGCLSKPNCAEEELLSSLQTHAKSAHRPAFFSRTEPFNQQIHKRPPLYMCLCTHTRKSTTWAAFF
jgi:hypothetical protein